MKKYFASLTGFRWLAAFMVFLCHFNPVPIFFSSHELSIFFSKFNTGVTLFFVLSGFLITYRYINSIQLNAKYLKHYFINRFARIYPLYFVFTTLNFLYTLRHPEYGTAPEVNVYLKYVLNLTFLRGFSESLLYSLVGQGWTLTVEETFYLIAPVVVYWYTLNLQRWSKLLLIATAFFGVSIATGFVLVKLFSGSSLGFFANDTFMLSHTFFGRSFEFALGSLLAVAIKRSEDTEHYSKAVFTYISVVLMFAVIYAIAIVDDRYSAPTVYLFLNNIVLPVTACGFIYGLLTEQTKLSTLLSSRLLVLLGKSSYAFYLIHIGLIYAEVKLRVPLGEPYQYVAVFLMLVIMSILLFKYVEEPLNTKIRKVFR